MAVGFVLLESAPGQELLVYRALKNVPEITELHPLLGEYDFIAKIEATDFDALGTVVLNKVRTIAGVSSTKTLAGTTL